VQIVEFGAHSLLQPVDGPFVRRNNARGVGRIRVFPGTYGVGDTRTVGSIRSVGGIRSVAASHAIDRFGCAWRPIVLRSTNRWERQADRCSDQSGERRPVRSDHAEEAAEPVPSEVTDGSDG
jgi:hypothetical protein